MNAKNIMSKVQVKIAKFADVVQNSKVYKTAEKVAVAAGAGITSLGLMAVSASAEGLGTLALAEVNSGDILTNAMPFINAGIPILVVVGGIRLGVRFLRGSMR